MGVIAGGVHGEAHFDVTQDAVFRGSVQHILVMATSYAARDGMAGETGDGLRWHVGCQGSAVRIKRRVTVIHEPWGASTSELDIKVAWDVAVKAANSDLWLDMVMRQFDRSAL